MPFIGNGPATLMDYAKTYDESTSILVDLLSQTNQLLQDMVWEPGNTVSGHITTVTVALPETDWRTVNQGVQPSKSARSQINEEAARMEGYAQSDEWLVDLAEDKRRFRLSENKPFLESMNQKMTQAFFYGSRAVDPRSFNGLAPRFNTFANGNYGVNPYAGQIIDAGGTGGNNTSIWLVNWGTERVHGFYPKNTKAGFIHNDLGLETVVDAYGGLYRAYRSQYVWNCGLAVRDYRQIVRIANIDYNYLVTNNAAKADLVSLMLQAVDLLPDAENGNPVFYMNNRLVTQLRAQEMNRPNTQLQMEFFEKARPRMMFAGIPVRKIDSKLLINTEARVV